MGRIQHLSTWPGGKARAKTRIMGEGGQDTLEHTKTTRLQMPMATAVYFGLDIADRSDRGSEVGNNFESRPSLV